MLFFCYFVIFFSFSLSFSFFLIFILQDEREWEAELEGELNEYELVEEETTANPEWEDEIQAMLAAETSTK